ncbi:hypothetical protein EMIT0194MI4_150061 [Pseudomonas sp. IT-194MI4]
MARLVNVALHISDAPGLRYSRHRSFSSDFGGI